MRGRTAEVELTAARRSGPVVRPAASGGQAGGGSAQQDGRAPADSLVRAKAECQEIAVAEEAPQGTNVVDLMEVLQGSLDPAQGARDQEPTELRQKKTAARKMRKPEAKSKTATKKAPQNAARSSARGRGGAGASFGS